MKKQREIVLTTDFSPIARAAFPYAARFAAVLELPIRLVHVTGYVSYPGPFPTPDRTALDAGLAHAREALSLEATFLRHLGATATTSLVQAVPVASALLRELRESAAAVVIGTSARRGITGLLTGSIVGKLVRHARVPVLAVPNAAAQVRIERIVYPTDFGPLAAEGLEDAMRYAKAFGAHLELLHIAEPPALAPWLGSRLEAATGRDMSRFGHELAKRRLARLAGRAAEAGVFASTRIVVGHKAAAAICEYADERGGSLIVMPSHGHHPISGLVLGATAERVIHASTAPVLVLKPRVRRQRPTERTREAA